MIKNTKPYEKDVLSNIVRALKNVFYGATFQDDKMVPFPSRNNMLSPIVDQPQVRGVQAQAPISNQRPQPTLISPLAKTTSTPMPTRTPTPPPVTPYPTRTFNQNQTNWANQLVQTGQQKGLKRPELMKAIGFNEGSLNPNPPPNITERERSFGPAQINLLAHPQITQQQAEDPNFAKGWMADRLKGAERLYPESIEKQLLYYNVPRNAKLNPSELSPQAIWYLVNALKTLGIIPSEEYLPTLQSKNHFK